jgi:hypothetical protein
MLWCTERAKAAAVAAFRAAASVEYALEPPEQQDDERNCAIGKGAVSLRDVAA